MPGMAACRVVGMQLIHQLSQCHVCCASNRPKPKSVEGKALSKHPGQRTDLHRSAAAWCCRRQGAAASASAARCWHCAPSRQPRPLQHRQPAAAHRCLPTGPPSARPAHSSGTVQQGNMLRATLHMWALEPIPITADASRSQQHCRHAENQPDLIVKQPTSVSLSCILIRGH